MKFLNMLQPIFFVINILYFFYFITRHNYNLAIISAAGAACYFVQTKLREQ
jgi:hypothetical protein